jgi:hypothetical protein
MAAAGLATALLATAPAWPAALPNGVIGNTLCLNADPDQSSYAHVESLLGKGAVESPSDNSYTPPRPHLLQRPGDSGNPDGPYFAILAIEPTDVNLDRKTMAEGGDRSRTEIKIAPSKGGVHEAFKAHQGDTQVYTWRFRIAEGMKFSPGFTHIHQIKANGGKFTDAPLITFTPLSKGVMDVRYVGDQTLSADHTVLGTMALAGLQGQWLAVRETTYSNSAGRYQLTIRDQQGKERLAIDRDGLQLWRSGADHMRPKWGIYRKHDTALNQNADDYVYFANFGITRGATPSSDCRASQAN